MFASDISEVHAFLVLDGYMRSGNMPRHYTVVLAKNIEEAAKRLEGDLCPNDMSFIRREIHIPFKRFYKLFPEAKNDVVTGDKWRWYDNHHPYRACLRIEMVSLLF